MFYYIYKITNTHTNKFYIGSHKTQDLNDGYFGSGIYLRRSITKYGINAFTKEYIEFCQTEEELRFRETEILKTIKNDDTYNLKFCAMGGNTREKYTAKQKLEYIQKLVNNPNSPIGKKGENAFNYGSKAANETRAKQSESRQKWFSSLRESPEEYNNYIKKLHNSGIKNIKKAIDKNKKPVFVFNDIHTIEFKSKIECIKHYGITSSFLNKCLRSSGSNKIELNQILKHKENCEIRKRKILNSKTQQYKRNIFKVINLKDESLLTTFYKIKDIIKYFNINYDQVRILQTRKIRRSNYTSNFLALFDSFKIVKDQILL